MVRQTSIDAYNAIKASGKLTELQWQVYEVIFTHGPVTQGECWDKYFKEHQRHDVCPRFAELKRLGVITDSFEKRECEFSGRKCVVWGITGTGITEEGSRLTAKEKIAFLKATAEIAAELLQKHGLADAAQEVRKNIQIASRT
jgi:hypothetical protein